jgi:hypothetical protein
VSARTSLAEGGRVQSAPVEEFFLHLWDDIDDVVHTCRHLTANAAVEVLTGAAPVVAALAGVLLGGAVGMLISGQHLPGLPF